MSTNLMEKMEISVRPIEQQGNLYGFASVTIGGIKIDDFKIVRNNDGELFVGMPSRADKRSETGYRNTVSVDKDIRESFSDAVLGSYHKAVEQAKTRTDKTRAASEKKPRMGEQVAEAGKEAKEYNDAQAKKEKGAKTRSDRGD